MNGFVVNGPVVNVAEVVGPAVDGPGVDRTEVDGPEVDGPGLDRSEVDGLTKYFWPEITVFVVSTLNGTYFTSKCEKTLFMILWLFYMIL